MFVLDGVSLDKIILASGNTHKYHEFQGLLAPLGIELGFGGDFKEPIEVEETGTNFIENAALKAIAWAKYTGIPAISDDSGTCALRSLLPERRLEKAHAHSIMAR